MTESPLRVPLSAAVMAALWLVGCQSSSSGRAGDSTSEDVGTASGLRVSAIRLERQPCFGTCPVYAVEVDSSGHVRFDGRAHVKVVGTARADIGKEAFRHMTEQLVRSGFPSLASTYSAGGEGCGAYATDLPVVVLTAIIDGTTKKVVHDYGCSGAPRVLRQLHQMIDSVANTSRWRLDS